MPTRNISLTTEQDAFVAKLVDSGEYQNASEALRDALRALQQRRREDALRLKALQARLDQGIAALDRGDYVELQTGAALQRYVEQRLSGATSSAELGKLYAGRELLIGDAAVLGAGSSRHRDRCEPTIPPRLPPP